MSNDFSITKTTNESNIVLVESETTTTLTHTALPPSDTVVSSDQGEADTIRILYPFFIIRSNLTAFCPTTSQVFPEYVYKVEMHCAGCKGAVEGALARAQSEGKEIENYNVSVENQTVTVKGKICKAELTKLLESTGKKILKCPDDSEMAKSDHTSATCNLAIP